MPPPTALPADPAPVRVLVIGDDPLARSALIGALEGRGELATVGQGTTQEDVGRLLEDLHPDLVLWDLGWGAIGDPAALETLAALGVPVVVLAADEEAAEGAWAAGVHSLLSRQVEPEPLARALLATSEGLAVLDPMLASVLLRSTPRDDATPLDPLTPREIEVLQLVAEGLPNKGIAARLGVSEHTAKFHVNAILRKLGAQSRTEAVVRATRHGLILL